MTALVLGVGGVLMIFMLHVSAYFHDLAWALHPENVPGAEPRDLDGPNIFATMVMCGWFPMLGGFMLWSALERKRDV